MIRALLIILSCILALISAIFGLKASLLPFAIWISLLSIFTLLLVHVANKGATIAPVERRSRLCAHCGENPNKVV